LSWVLLEPFEYLKEAKEYLLKEEKRAQSYFPSETLIPLMSTITVEIIDK